MGKGRVEEVVYNGIIFLANGVTSTWSAGEYHPERAMAQRDRIDAGESIGPRLFASGPYFGAFRCEYSIKTATDDCIGWPNDITEEEIRREVDYWAGQGVLSVARGNPLDDIKAARDIKLVIKNGVAYEPEVLLRSVEGKIGPAGPDDLADWALEIRPLRQD